MVAGAHVQRKQRRTGRVVWVAAACVVALLAAGIVFKLTFASREAAADATGCDARTTVHVAVVPELVEVVKKAAGAVAESCRTIEVRAEPAADVVADLQGGATAPDLWIPDSTVWLARLTGSGVSAQTVSDAVASSPVVLVGGPAAEADPSWTAGLSSGLVSMPDPMASAVGALAMLAPRSEKGVTGSTDEEVRAVLVPMAQAYGERRADGRADDVSLDSVTNASQQLIPATERAYLAARDTDGILTALVPATGAPLLTYPLVAPQGASVPILQAGRQLAAWFTSADGVAALGAEGLRGGDGSPSSAAGGVGPIKPLTTPDAVAVAADLRTWQVTSVPSSVLAVFDASGSTDFKAGHQTRMELAVGVAHTALAIFPDHARIGLWVFSIDQGGHGQDWRTMEPMRRLDATVGGLTQRELLNKRADQMLGLTQGGTGLYDTTLAAYQQAVRDYNPAYSNAVVLLTDGANDDPGSISLDGLLGQLKKLSDPQRPVRVIGIAISKDADFGSLDKIAKATGGQAYYAKDPNDITKVFAEALAAS